MLSLEREVEGGTHEISLLTENILPCVFGDIGFEGQYRTNRI